MLSAFIFFLVLITALLWVIIHSDGHWLLKFIFITFSIYFSVSIFFSFNNFKGWPSEQPMPANFQLHWIVIEEPDKVTDDPGAIYLWVSPIKFQSNCAAILLCIEEIDTTQPRAYKMKYNIEDHQKSVEINEKLQQGSTIIGKNKDDENMIEPKRENNKFLEDFKMYELPNTSPELRK